MKAKKSLGQNFLHSKSVLFAIVKAGNLSDKETVLEIGPGTGMLTRELLKTGAKVVAVEKDDALIPVLNETFADEIKSGQLTLVHADILDLNPLAFNLYPLTYILIANIPYYLTGLIFRKFIGGDSKPKRAVLLVQKEVATRIVARDGKESILSLSVKAFGNPKIVTKVPKTAFRPAPNVDSAVLLIEDINDGGLNKKTQEAFFETLHASFAHKRKRLFSNLAGVFGKEKADLIFEKLSLSENTRAEDLKIETWKKISQLI
jgi:16S rRNA (adenine1518-N6/adenine1519-N6)-dimethyltransferase